jgi:hypothetical protein
LGTCNGCHSAKSHDTLFHLSPFRSGEERLSPYLRDEELARRKTTMTKTLCSR